MSKRSIAVIQLVLAGLLWSISGVFIKMVDLHPFAISAVRSCFAALVLLTYVKFKPRFTFSRPQIAGALCYVATVSLFVVANKITTSANAILLQYGAPIYAAIMGYFILHEKLRWYDIVAMVGVAAGMITFFGDSMSGGRLLGNILAIISGVTFAGQAVCLRLQKDGAVETIILGNIFAIVIGLPFLVMTPPSLAQMPPLFVLGVFQLGVSYLLYTLASGNVTALDMIILPMIEPILNPVWVYLGTGETPGVYALIGGAIILFTVGFKSYFAARQEREPAG